MTKTLLKLISVILYMSIIPSCFGQGISVVNTINAPAAIGPYSQAIKCGDMVYCSGQIGIDPGTGNLELGGIAAQTTQALVNINSVLKEAGSSYDKVVKVTIYMVDLKDFATVNEIYAKYFPDLKPARSTVQVAALPKGALIEIECVAALK